MRRLSSENRLYHLPDFLLLIIVAGYGLIMRFGLYLQNRSLWLDESLLALAFLETPYLKFLDPLPYGQSAPIGYLLLQKGIVKLFGESEMALRLPSLAGGILAPIFLFAAVRLISRSLLWATIAVALLAVSPALIRYSAEVKQYSLEAAMSAALLFGVAFLVRHP